MKKIRFVLIAFTMMLSFSSFAQTAEEVQEKFNQAATAFNEKNYAAAIPLFTEAIKMGAIVGGDAAETVKQSKDLLVMTYINKGKGLASQKQFDEALVDFKEGATLATANMDLRGKSNAETMVSAVYGVKGNEQFKANQYAAAAAIYEEAYKYNEKDTKNGILAAKSYSLAGEADKAIAIYNGIIALGESNSRYAQAGVEAKTAAIADMLVSAINEIKVKAYDKALVALDSALKFDPKNANALLVRLQVLNDAKKYSELVKYGQESVDAQSDAIAKSNAAFFVAIAYQELKNNAKAIEFYKKVVAGPNTETAKKIAADLAKVIAG